MRALVFSGWVLASLTCAASVASIAVAQSPEDHGPLTIMEWDAGSVSTAGASIPRRVLYPDSGGPYPVVGVIHGASRTGAQHIELARTLASWGFVVVLPDMPCGFTGCDHDANAMQLTALLEWVVAQSADGTSRIAGLVDPERRGLIGHSWGALASHLTAARDASIDSVVLFDPNDDGTVGRDATSAIGVPELQLLAEVPGACNSQWAEASVTPMLPDPHLQMTVVGSAHCDPEEPGDALCPIACGRGDASTSTIFRRYAVAWTACVLASDARVSSWLTDGALASDGALSGIVSSGLAALPCASVTPGEDAGLPQDPDGGSGDVDSGTASDVDAGAMADGGASVIDGGVRRDGGVTLYDRNDGCGCSIPGAPSQTRYGWLFVIGLALLIASRRR